MSPECNFARQIVPHTSDTRCSNRESSVADRWQSWHAAPSGDRCWRSDR